MLKKTIIGFMLALFAGPLSAHAELPGQPCTAAQIGTTKMADDKQNIIACLLTGKTKPANVQEWKSFTKGSFEETSLQGGIYTVNFWDGNTCRSLNPLTGGCSCPKGFTSSVTSEFYNPACLNGYYDDNGSRTVNCGVVQYQCVNSKQVVRVKVNP
ncbi:MAG: hypothetical protein IPI58_05465 [Alphaproteobacteria bacterium]|nr:MAG: hypothetical protein IPI58_05465 [Alphaproteobacteria bacterium]